MNDQDLKSVLRDAAGPAELPERFRNPSALVHRAGQPSQGILAAVAQWVTALRLGHNLEIAAACGVLAILLGLVAYRGPHAHQAPAGGEHTNPPGTHGDPQSTAQSPRLVGKAEDGVVGLEVIMQRLPNGDGQVAATIRNLTSTPIQLRYDCDEVVRFNGSLVKRDCTPLPPVTVEAGQSWDENRTIPASWLGGPTEASVVLNQPQTTSPHWLTVPLRESGPITSASDVARILKTAGLTVVAKGEVSSKLFGAERIEALVVQGKTLNVYSFADDGAAERALKASSDPQSNTVSWVERPHSIRKGNLLLILTSDDEMVVKQVVVALMSYDRPLDGPMPYLVEGRAVEIARQVDPKLSWKAVLRATQFDVTIRGARVQAPVWIVEGSDSAARTTVLYLDGNTGKEVTRLQVEETAGKISEAATPEATVQRYFTLTAAGRYEDAWPYIHRVAQRPGAGTAVGATLAWFYNQEGRPGPKLKAIKSATMQDQWKAPTCMCQLQPAAVVTVELDDGTSIAVHLGQDQSGNWRLLWSSRGPM